MLEIIVRIVKLGTNATFAENYSLGCVHDGCHLGKFENVFIGVIIPAPLK